MPTPSEAQGEAAATGQEDALARSVLYSALAAGLQRPAAASRQRLLGAQGPPALALAAEVVDGHGGALAAAVARLDGPPLAELSARYDALFGHTARGPVCAFETEYGADDPFRQPQELAHIAGYYRAFGLRPGPDGERVDHVACECEFMALLAVREACLLQNDAAGDAAAERAEQLEVTRRSARDFLRGHLGRFGLAFAGRLLSEDEGGFFGTLAEVLSRLLGREAERLGVALGPPTLDLRPPAVDATPMACGSCPELVRPRGGL